MRTGPGRGGQGTVVECGSAASNAERAIVHGKEQGGDPQEVLSGSKPKATAREQHSGVDVLSDRANSGDSDTADSDAADSLKQSLHMSSLRPDSSVKRLA